MTSTFAVYDWRLRCAGQGIFPHPEVISACALCDKTCPKCYFIAQITNI
jgi:hypothetical protein